ncbi:MAG: OmpA family protein [Cyclobacteriaceae bacterium]|nr:OmpA family protein [Cyclobacteriaceae bacterium]
MKRYLLLVITLGVITITGNAQELTVIGKANRFVPYSIDTAINTNYHEINPVFSLDEKTLYFSRVDHPENHYGRHSSQDIWYSELQSDGNWSVAQRLDAPFNNNRFNALYSISDDGKHLVTGVYTNKGRYKKRGLSVVEKTENGWSLPEKFKVPRFSKRDKGIISTVFLNKESDILLLSYSSAWQKASNNKIRYSTKKKNGKWKSPKPLKNSNLKSRFTSIESPFMSEDGSTIYFSAYGRSASNYYKSDIYKITRPGDSFDNWSSPVRLSNTINSNDWENYYKLFNEENWAVFNAASIGDDSDIFIVKLNEPRPYVDLHGIVKLDDKPFKETFKVMINGDVVDSVRINRDSSSYAVQLPLGGRYEIMPNSGEMEAKMELIDATYELEYMEMERDLELSLIPFLDLSGKVTVNGKLLTDPFSILINGFKVDSVITNPLTGTYSVKLPLGRVYQLQVRSGNYIPEMETVDVSSDTKQIRVFKDLKMKAIPYVDVRGSIVNLDTNLAIPHEANPKIMINGEVVDSISTVTGSYYVRLPWGQKYILQVQADEFAPVAAVVDLINVSNYAEMTRSLFVNPLQKYATITGKVLNMKTGATIKDNFVIDVNGSRSTNSNMNASNGTYEVRVSLGEKIVLTASAQNYFPISEIIDLSEEVENIKVYKDLQLMPLKIGEHILLNHIVFETASSNLKPESFPDIDRVVDLLRAVPTLKIEIEGYTDSSGKDSYNLGLSNSRAHSVTSYILSKGISAQRVQYKGYGEEKPIATNLTPEGRAKNRRVEFLVLEQ